MKNKNKLLDRTEQSWALPAPQPNTFKANFFELLDTPRRVKSAWLVRALCYRDGVRIQSQEVIPKSLLPMITLPEDHGQEGTGPGRGQASWG